MLKVLKRTHFEGHSHLVRKHTHNDGVFSWINSFLIFLTGKLYGKKNSIKIDGVFFMRNPNV